MILSQILVDGYPLVQNAIHKLQPAKKNPVTRKFCLPANVVKATGSGKSETLAEFSCTFRVLTDKDALYLALIWPISSSISAR